MAELPLLFCYIIASGNRLLFENQKGKKRFNFDDFFFFNIIRSFVVHCKTPNNLK